MNFFRRMDAFRKPVEDEAPGPGEAPVAVAAGEPEERAADLAEGQEWRAAFEEAQEPALDEGEAEPDTDEADGTPVAAEDPVSVDEADEARPSPFEARLARLRQQLQDGPRPVPEAPARWEAEPEPGCEPAEPEVVAASLHEVAADLGPEVEPELEPELIAEPEPELPVRSSEGLAAEPPLSMIAEAVRSAVEAEAEVPRVPEAPMSMLPEAPMPRVPEAAMPIVPDMPMPIVSEPPLGMPGRRAGRVKTRLLGFERSDSAAADPLGSAAKAESAGRFPVGWIVVVKGPGRGASFCLYNGLAQIGRGSDQTVCLDFGDTSISRENHAVVAYDAEQKKHFLGHGGKANIVRLNDMPVLSTEALAHGDQIRIGETTLRFVALCGADFDWSMTATDDEFDAGSI